MKSRESFSNSDERDSFFNRRERVKYVKSSRETLLISCRLMGRGERGGGRRDGMS